MSDGFDSILGAVTGVVAGALSEFGAESNAESNAPETAKEPGLDEIWNEISGLKPSAAVTRQTELSAKYEASTADDSDSRKDNQTDKLTETQTLDLSADSIYPNKMSLVRVQQVPQSKVANAPKGLSDQSIFAIASQLRQDMRVDKWVTDFRGGDTDQALLTLSALPRDSETMLRLQKAYSADAAHPNANLVKDIESRFSKEDASSLKAIIDPSQSKLARLEAASQRGTSQSIRELRAQLSMLSSDDIASLNDQLLSEDGKSLERLLLQNAGMREADKVAIKILLQGSDARANNPELSNQMGAEAIKAKDLDMLREALSSSPEARELFRRRGNVELLPLAFNGKDLETALDIAARGELQTSTLVVFNQGLFGTDKDGVEQAIKLASPEQLNLLRRGHELARAETCSTNPSAHDLEAIDTYGKFEQSLKSSFNARVAGELESQAIYGDKNIISRLAQTHSDGLIGIGSGHDRMRVFDIVDRELSSDDFRQLKSNRNFIKDLENNLKTFLADDELSLVKTILDRKMQASTFEQSKSFGRNITERLEGYRDGGVSDEERAAVISDILKISAKESMQYRLDASYRNAIDKQLIEILGSDSESAKITRRLLDSVHHGNEPKLTALERIQVGGLKRDSLPQTVENIEKYFRSDATALNRLKNPDGEPDRQARSIVERELRMAVYRSGKVYYDKDGKSNLDDVYRPIAISLLEKSGKLELAKKISLYDRDIAAYQALAKATPAERAALLKSSAQSEEEKSMHRQVFSRFDRTEEKLLVNEILSTGQFNIFHKLRAAAVTQQSLQQAEIEELKYILAQVEPERRIALNDEYTKRYGDTLTNIVGKLPTAEQPAVTAMLNFGQQNSAEQIDLLSRQRRVNESGLLGGGDFSSRYAALQSSDNLRKANENASSRFEKLPKEESQRLFVIAQETIDDWKKQKHEASNAVTDGAIVVGSLAVTMATMGATTPMLVGVVGISGGYAKVLGNKALLGDGYDLGKPQRVLSDAAAGFTNAATSMLGPEQLAAALKLGDVAAAATTKKFIVLLAEESLVNSKYLLTNGGEEVIEKGLRTLYHEAIARGSTQIPEAAVNALVAEVATEGSRDVLARTLIKSMNTSQPARAEAVLKALALNASVGSAAGSSSELVLAAAEWDSSKSAAANLSAIARRTASGALFGGGAGAVFTVGFKVLGRLRDDVARTFETAEVGLRSLGRDGSFQVSGLSEKDLYMITLRKDRPPEILTHDGALTLKADEKLVVINRTALKSEYENLSPSKLKRKFEESGIVDFPSFARKALKDDTRIFVESRAKNETTNFYVPVEAAPSIQRESLRQAKQGLSSSDALTPFAIQSDLIDLPDGGKLVKRVVLENKPCYSDPWGAVKFWDKNKGRPLVAPQSADLPNQTLEFYPHDKNMKEMFRRLGVRHEWSHLLEDQTSLRKIYDEALELEALRQSKPLLLRSYAGFDNHENWAVHIGEGYMADSDVFFRHGLVEPAKGTVSEIKELIHAKALEEALLAGAASGHKAPRYDELLARSRWAQSELAPGAKNQLEDLISNPASKERERELAIMIYPALFGTDELADA